MAAKRTPYLYDVCLSFAGEDRQFVRAVAAQLKAKGLRVFYDEDQVAGLWGKNLFEHLHHIYSTASRFCIVFISKAYAAKSWTIHERRSAQERVLAANAEYILPARFDRTKLPGIYETIGHVNLQKYTPKTFADLVVTKIRPDLVVELQQMKCYLPPDPDIFLKRFGRMSKREKGVLQVGARAFLDRLSKMSKKERAVIGALLGTSCPAELPDYVHANADLVRRAARMSEASVLETLKGLDSLGVEIKTRRFDRLSRADIVFRWRASIPECESLIGLGSNLTAIAHEMVDVVRSHYCEEHFMEMIKLANFACLSSATAVADAH